MKKPFALAALIAVCVAGGAAWWHWRASLGAAAHATGASSRADAAAGKGALSPDAVLKIRPSAAAPSRARDGVLAPLMKTPPSELQKLFVAGDYAEVLKRAQQLPQDGEALRLTAQVFEECVKPSDLPNIAADLADRYEKARALLDAKKTNEKRESVDKRAIFLARLLPSDSDYEKRVNAFDRLAHIEQKSSTASDVKNDACSSIKTTKVSITQLRDLWKSAAGAGDIPAKMREFECSLSSNPIEQAAATSPEQLAEALLENERRQKVTEEKLRELQSLIALRNDALADRLLRVLTSSFANGEFALNGVPLASTSNGWERYLASCDISQNCESDLRRYVDEACAFKGECAAATHDDYIRFYVLAPAQTQKLEQQRTSLATMIASGNAQQLRLRLAPPPTADGERKSNYYSESYCY
jgi:hypothetical protein